MGKIDLNKIHLFKWEELYYIELETQIGFSALTALNISQERSLIESQQRFEKAIAEDPVFDEIGEHNQGHYYTHVYEREDMIIQELKRQQRFSLILSIFSFYEGRLKTICDRIEQRFDFKIKVDDLSGNDDLMRYWNYLEKVFEIDTQKCLVNFTPIKQQKIVRNIIAHQDGIATLGQKKKIVKATGLDILTLHEELRINISEITYLHYIIDKMELFFKDLLVSIDLRYEEIKPKGLLDNITYL